MTVELANAQHLALDKINEAFKTSYKVGYEDGHIIGYREGQASFSSVDYSKGYAEGYKKALSDFAEKMKQSIKEGSDWLFNRAFYHGMVSGIKTLLEKEIKDAKDYKQNMNLQLYFYFQVHINMIL